MFLRQSSRDMESSAAGADRVVGATLAPVRMGLVSLSIISILTLVGFGKAGASDLFPEISKLLVLSVRELPGATETDAFEDDIEDPLPPNSLLDPFVTDELQRSYPPTDIAASAEYPGGPHAESGGSFTINPSSLPPTRSEAASPSLVAELPSPSPKPTGSQNEGPTSERPSSQKVASDPRDKKSVKVLGFSDAQRAFDAALKGPQVPWQVRLFIGKASKIKMPKDPLHISFLAGLLQVGTYGLRCAQEFRRLRHMDKGKVTGTVQEIQSLRAKATVCMEPIKLFLTDAKERLGPPMTQKGTQGGWDKAAALLDSVYVSAIAMEKNFIALTNYMEARQNPQTPKNVVFALKKERDDAKIEYEAAKATMKTHVKACESKGLVPRSFPLL